MSIPDSQWRPDGTGVTNGGDEAGGDIQAGDAYSVRYVRPDEPAAMITVTFYATEDADRNPGEYGVERKVEWYVAGPDGDELWSDEDRDEMPVPAGLTESQATQEAGDYARFALGMADTHGWDGQPDYRNGAA